MQVRILSLSSLSLFPLPSHVIVAFIWCLVHHSRLLEQIICVGCSADVAATIEEDFNVLSDDNRTEQHSREQHSQKRSMEPLRSVAVRCCDRRSLQSLSRSARANQPAHAAVTLAALTFPNRDELLFLSVLAFPNASRIGLLMRIRSSGPTVDVEPAISAMYCRHCFVHSVFPAPDSPLITIDCEMPFSRR